MQANHFPHELRICSAWFMSLHKHCELVQCSRQDKVSKVEWEREAAVWGLFWVMLLQSLERYTPVIPHL